MGSSPSGGDVPGAAAQRLEDVEAFFGCPDDQSWLPPRSPARKEMEAVPNVKALSRVRSSSLVNNRRMLAEPEARQRKVRAKRTMFLRKDVEWCSRFSFSIRAFRSVAM